jgi:hypothetical protein
MVTVKPLTVQTLVEFETTVTVKFDEAVGAMVTDEVAVVVFAGAVNVIV